MKKQICLNQPFLILAFCLVILAVLLAIFISPFLTLTKATDETADNILIVRDHGSSDRWNQLLRLNIFNNSSFDGEKIIAPYSKGIYTFSLENIARAPVAFTINITEENIFHVPMVFRLVDNNGNYIYGTDTDWVTASELHSISGELARSEDIIFTLEWKWAEISDTFDTTIGIQARDHVEYILNFIILAEQKGSDYDQDLPQTGDTTNLALYFTLLILSLILVVIMAILYKRDRRNQN